MSEDEKTDTISEDHPPHQGERDEPIGLAPKLRAAVENALRLRGYPELVDEVIEDFDRVVAAHGETPEEHRATVRELDKAFARGEGVDVVGGATCPDCARPADAVNHVAGHVFMTYGQGWQVCPRCRGTQRIAVTRDEPTKPDATCGHRLSSVTLAGRDRHCVRAALHSGPHASDDAVTWDSAR